MRKRFEQQLSLGVVSIGEVRISRKTRHQLAPTLVALQYVFTDERLSGEIFRIMEEKLVKGKQATGRPGMSLWEILVLGMSKLCLDVDYDFLHDMANNHEELRGVLGVQKSDYTEGREYHYQTLVDNVQLLDEDTLKAISNVIVKGAHEIVKKKEGRACLNLSVKADSFVVEKDIHFPTDMNLLWDSGRKCLDIINVLRSQNLEFGGWRQLNSWYKKLRKVYRVCAEIHRKKGANYRPRLKAAAESYLSVCELISGKLEVFQKEFMLHVQYGDATVKEVNCCKSLLYYKEMLDKHRDLVHRRLVLGEKIPHSEKVFSVFETETEWLCKGKANNKVELGHNVQVATDQYHLILHHEVSVNQVDKQRTIAISNSLVDNFCGEGYSLDSISFDRNYYSLPAKTALGKQYEHVILPKPGKKSRAQQDLESSNDFTKRQKKHSTVEANISQLEHHGLSKCRDKGMDGFKRYVAYGVLAYNLHRMGSLLIQIEKEAEAKLRKKGRRGFSSLKKQALRKTQ